MKDDSPETQKAKNNKTRKSFDMLSENADKLLEARLAWHYSDPARFSMFKNGMASETAFIQACLLACFKNIKSDPKFDQELVNFFPESSFRTPTRLR